MKKFFLLIFVSIFLLMATTFSAHSAENGSCTHYVKIAGGMRILVSEWTSHASNGSVTEVCTFKKISGMVLGVQFEPNADVSNAYDAECLDAGGMDILNGVGADQPTTDLTDIKRVRTPFNNDSGYITLYDVDLDLQITNAGNSKSGKVYIFLNKE